jgi:hypothetical protein
MRALSVRFKRELVSLAIAAAMLAIYLPFMDEAWSLYFALCVGYTILVFGMLWSDGKWKKYVELYQRSMRNLMQGHAVFVLVLIFWIWICRFARPWLPDWMFDEYGRGITPFLIFGALGLVAIWWVEQSWLAKSPKKDEQIGVLPQ